APTTPVKPGDRVVYMYAHRDLERQLAEGSPRESDMVARPRQAGRAPDARNQAGRSRRAYRRVPAGRLRAGSSWPGPMEWRGHRKPVRAGRRYYQLRPTAT